MTAGALLVTGAGGYVGRRLLELRGSGGFERVVALVHRPGRVPEHVAARGDVSVVVGDVLDRGLLERSLAGCSRVLHLAAATGKASRRRHLRVNVEGTRTLLEACRTAGTGGIVHVSSIAVGFTDRPRYHYAEAKEAAEALVAASGLDHLVVRPTIVAGPGAPVLEGLARLAGAPVVPVFGNGRARVQPIFVDDLVGCLGDVLERPRLGGGTLEVGGPEVVTIEELLLLLRRLRYGRRPRRIHVPLRPLRAVLGLLERPLGRLLPLSAGQLATFANDGTAASSPFFEERRGRMADLETMLRADPKG